VPFEKLYESNSFEEVAYLLIWNVIPTPEQLRKFRSDFAKYASPPQAVIDTIKGFP
jgi:citrate synthase